MMDREMEIRVWQRVLGQAAEDGDLVRLIQLSRLQAEEFRFLDRELYRQEKITLGLLTGLYHLYAGKDLAVEGNRSPGGTRAARVRRCRDRCNEILRLCIRLENHPRYGALFTDLTRRQRACCARLEQWNAIK